MAPAVSQNTAVGVKKESAETDAQALARFSLCPSFSASVTAMRFDVGHYPTPKGALDLNELIGALESQCKAASAGDLSQVEHMLVSQAHALDAIFNSLAQRAAVNFGEHINAGEMYLRLAMRAQAQCRSTIEALGVLKNPHPVAFVHQANIANGPQQVNNARAGQIEERPNKLLEVPDGQRMDAAAKTEAGIAHSPVEAVAGFYRSTIVGGQEARGRERLQGRNATSASDAGQSPQKATA